MIRVLVGLLPVVRDVVEEVVDGLGILFLRGAAFVVVLAEDPWEYWSVY